MIQPDKPHKTNSPFYSLSVPIHELARLLHVIFFQIIITVTGQPACF